MTKTTFNYNIKKITKIQKKIQKIKQLFHAYMPLFLMIFLYFSGKMTLSIIIPAIYMGIGVYIYMSKAERENKSYDLYFSNTALVAIILALHVNAI